VSDEIMAAVLIGYAIGLLIALIGIVLVIRIRGSK
jgi:hypothetical protein